MVYLLSVCVILAEHRETSSEWERPVSCPLSQTADTWSGQCKQRECDRATDGKTGRLRDSGNTTSTCIALYWATCTAQVT